jgi:hypothetical protein
VLYDRDKMGRETEEGNVSLHNFEQLYGMIASRTKNYSDEKICGMVNVLLKIIEWSSPRYKLNFNNIRHPIKFTRIDIFGKEEVFEIYLSTLTIRTNIVHPKSRKNQAYRTALPLEILKQMLTNVTGRGKGLRLHADNLYRQKKT